MACMEMTAGSGICVLQDQEPSPLQHPSDEGMPCLQRHRPPCTTMILPRGRRNPSFADSRHAQRMFQQPSFTCCSPWHTWMHDDGVVCLVHHVVSHLGKDHDCNVVLSTWSDPVFLIDEPGFDPQLDPNDRWDRPDRFGSTGLVRRSIREEFDAREVARDTRRAQRKASRSTRKIRGNIMRGLESVSFALGLVVLRHVAAHADTYPGGEIHEDVRAYLEEKHQDTSYAENSLDRSRFYAETSQYPNTDIHGDGPSCSWMGELHAELESHTLFELTLPGTHNCGSYLLSEELMPGDWGEKSEAALKVAEFLHIPVEDVITPWSLTQDRSVLKQLELGSRYLDLRAGWNGKQWRTFHLEQGVLISDVLADVEAFMAKHPMEIVYLEVSHLVGSPTREQVVQLASMIQKICSVYLLPRSFPLQKKTIGDIVRSGKRLIASLATSQAVLDNYPQIWPGYTFYNTYANTDELQRMVGFNERAATWFTKYRRELLLSGFLYKLSWTLTPQVHTIVDSILTRNPRNLYTLARLAAEHFDAFSLWMNGRGMQGGNILLFDFLDLSLNRTEVCKSMIALVRAVNPLLQTAEAYV